MARTFYLSGECARRRTPSRSGSSAQWHVALAAAVSCSLPHSRIPDAPRQCQGSGQGKGGRPHPAHRREAGGAPAGGRPGARAARPTSARPQPPWSPPRPARARPGTPRIRGRPAAAGPPARGRRRGRVRLRPRLPLAAAARPRLPPPRSRAAARGLARGLAPGRGLEQGLLPPGRLACARASAAARAPAARPRTCVGRARSLATCTATHASHASTPRPAKAHKCITRPSEHPSTVDVSTGIISRQAPRALCAAASAGRALHVRAAACMAGPPPAGGRGVLHCLAASWAARAGRARRACGVRP